MNSRLEEMMHSPCSHGEHHLHCRPCSRERDNAWEVETTAKRQMIIDRAFRDTGFHLTVHCSAVGNRTCVLLWKGRPIHRACAVKTFDKQLELLKTVMIFFHVNGGCHHES